MQKIPLHEALALIRDFGLLVNQVTFYGISHKVIQQQALNFFATLKQVLTDYGHIEFSLLGDKAAVNDSSDGIDMMSARNLREKMILHKLPSISFDPLLTQQEFFSFLSYLGTPPVTIQGQGGVEALLKKADIKGISLSHFVYQRVDAKDAKTETAPQSETAPQVPAKPRKRSVKPARDGGAQTEAVLQEGYELIKRQQQAPTQARIRRKRVRSELNSLLTEVTQLVSSEGAPKNEQVVETLRTIRDALRNSTEPSKERIATLMGQPDKLDPASLTGKHAKKVSTFKLTYKEFMSRYAELTQEIAQPLTVTNGVIELLRHGQVGALNEAQTNFLDLALESVDRVNQLIKYMHTLSGEPESYTPDMSIIKETYT
jgi:signal transduction histidine kinase